MLFFFFSMLLSATAYGQLLHQRDIELKFEEIQVKAIQFFSHDSIERLIEPCFSRLNANWCRHIPTFEKDQQLLFVLYDAITLGEPDSSSHIIVQELITTHYLPQRLQQRALLCVWALLKNYEIPVNPLGLINFLESSLQHTQLVDTNTNSYKADSALFKSIRSDNVEEAKYILLTYYLQPEQNYLQLIEGKRALEFILPYSLFHGKAHEQQDSLSTFIISSLIEEGINVLTIAIQDFNRKN